MDHASIQDMTSVYLLQTEVAKPDSGCFVPIIILVIVSVLSTAPNFPFTDG